MALLQKIEKKFLELRANNIFRNFDTYIKGNKILDFGCGWGSFTDLLRKKGFKVTPVDIVKKSLYSNIDPIIYDGKSINFRKKKFDTALVITVLHHTPNPEHLLKELAKVSKRIIVVEDIYNNKIHQKITYFFDCLANWEWKKHPHTNKNDIEWKQIFSKLGLQIIETKYKLNSIVFKHGYYILE